MNLQEIFAQLLTPEAALATRPLVALGFGVLLLLVCDVVPALRPARGACFVGALALAFLFQLQILSSPPGAVLEGTLIADRASALFGCMFVLGTLLAWTYGLDYYRAERPYRTEHDALMLAAPAGMMLMVGANDLLIFFVGLELLSIPLYALAAFRRARTDSVEAGMKYFLLGAFSTAMYVYGAGLVYVTTGTLSIDALASADLSGAVPLFGLALIASSLFFKVSVFPFHLWVPDVYQGSPTPVTALMATGTKAAAFGFLIARLMPALPHSAAGLVAVLALVTLALGNLGALVQSDLKRMLAYSGVAHAGTLLLVLAGGLAGADVGSAVGATVFYMGAYVFTATGAFGLIALLEASGERFTRIDSLRGLARSRPGTAAALALFLLSLGGLPATGGFLGKWFAFSVLVEAGWIGTAILGALMSVVALGYYLRVIVAMYMQPAEDEEPRPVALPGAIATGACVAGVLVLGLLPGVLLRLL